MDSRTWRWLSLRWFPLCGIVVPLLDALVLGLVMAGESGYDPVTQYGSILAETGRPHALIVCAWWIAFPFLYAPFAAAVYTGVRGNRCAWVTLT
jgi:hypothetical protein